MLIEATIVGIGIGIVVGALGAGGGILSVPVLVYLLGQNPHQAATLSLIIVGATACVSLVTRAPSGHVDWKNGSLFAFAGIVGTWGGSALNPLVSARTLMLEFCILLAFVAIFMVHKQLRTRADAFPSSIDEAAREESPHSLASTLKKAALVVLLASVTGFLTGFFGVGGGFRYRSCASPCSALPNEKSISNVPVDHGHYSSIRLGFACTGRNLGYQCRGWGDGCLLCCGLDVRRHCRSATYSKGKLNRISLGIHCSLDRSCQRERLCHATRITEQIEAERSRPAASVLGFGRSSSDKSIRRLSNRTHNHRIDIDVTWPL